MAYWLIKEEPGHYSWSDLVRDGRTEWNGIHNATALRNLRAMRVGEQAIYYHTGSERACVGLVEVVAPPRADPNDVRGSWLVEVSPVRPLARPVGLAEIRSDPAFERFDLVRIGRLTVVFVSDAHWARILELGSTAAPVAATGARAGRGRRTAPRKRRRAARRRR